MCAELEGSHWLKPWRSRSKSGGGGGMEHVQERPAWVMNEDLVDVMPAARPRLP